MIGAVLLWTGVGSAAPLLGDLPQLATDPARAEERLQLVAVPATPEEAHALARQLARVPSVRIELVAGGLVQLEAPARHLRPLATTAGLCRLRRPHHARESSKTSEGVETIFLQDWHQLGLTGEGVRIAIVDSGFAGYEALLGEDLPAEVSTLFISDADASEHGTAVAEIVHDVAPGAALQLVSFDTEVEFLSACEQLSKGDAQVVNCSVSWDNVWHPDDDNLLSQAVNALVEQGLIWVQSAGNEAENYWSGTLADQDGDGWLELDGQEQIAIFADEGYASASLRWDEPYGSAALDLQLVLYPAGDKIPCAWADDPQDGSGDPWEAASCHTDDEALTLAIFDESGQAAGSQAWLWSYWGLDEALVRPEQTVSVPGASSGAIAVGAVHWWDHVLAPYSSQGPTYDGRLKPDLSAPTAVTTASQGILSFTGTSAAAPHAAGAAALLVQASDHAYGPDEVRAWLQEGALDLGDAGWDNAFGAGYLQLDRPPGLEPDTGADADTGGGGERGGEPGGCGCGGARPGPECWLLVAIVLGGVGWGRGR